MIASWMKKALNFPKKEKIYELIRHAKTKKTLHQTHKSKISICKQKIQFYKKEITGKMRQILVKKNSFSVKRAIFCLKLIYFKGNNIRILKNLKIWDFKSKGKFKNIEILRLTSLLFSIFYEIYLSLISSYK